MHPIIVLWAHPRSMSTATERVMRERGDLACLHEPFMHDYYHHRAVRVMPGFEPDPSLPHQYEAIRDDILARGEESPVFFKDMAYYVVPQIFEDPDFARRLTHLFILRDPRRAILSYHKLDPDLTREEVGIEAQGRLHDWLENELARPAWVLTAEAIQADTRGLMTALWAEIGLPPAPQAFSWDREETPEGWEQVTHWHGEVTSSGGIRRESPEEVARHHAAFAAAAAKTPLLKELLNHHRPFYEKLHARAFHR